MGINFLLNTAGVLAAAISIAFLVKPKVYAATLAYVALVLFHFGEAIWLDANTIITWAVITFITCSLDLMQRTQARFSEVSAVYMTVGAACGAIIGYTLYPRLYIPGAVAGTFLALLAFVKTPAGRYLQFPSSVFFNYFCAYGLRIIVVISMAAMVVITIFSRHIAESSLHRF